MTKATPPAFVTPAQPGWAVVRFYLDDENLPDPEDIEMLPVLAWATWPDTRTAPITVEGDADLDNALCAPDGEVYNGCSVYSSPREFVTNARERELFKREREEKKRAAAMAKAAAADEEALA